MRRSRAFIGVVLVLSVLFTTPQPAPASGYPAIDAVHAAQAQILQYGHLVMKYLAYAQRALALYRQYQQLRIALKNIESWEDLGMYFAEEGINWYLTSILDNPNTLSYMRSKGGLARDLDRLYPKTVDLETVSTLTSDRRTKNRYTLRQNLVALARLGQSNDKILTQLKQAQDTSRASHEQLKEVEASNMFRNVLAQDSYRQLQANFLITNTLALEDTNDRQQEEEIAKMTSTIVDVDRGAGRTGEEIPWIPLEWSW